MPDRDDRDFDALRSLLASASEMADELLRDPLFARLLNVFTRMPEGDREAIITVLEREVQRRLLSQNVSDDLSKVDLHPNPNAQLYFRVVGQEPQKPVETVAFLRAAKSIQRGIDALDPQWRDLVRGAMGQLDPAGLQSIAAFNQAIGELLEEVKAKAAAATDAPAAEEPPPSPVVTGKRSRG